MKYALAEEEFAYLSNTRTHPLTNRHPPLSLGTHLSKPLCPLPTHLNKHNSTPLLTTQISCHPILAAKLRIDILQTPAPRLRHPENTNYHCEQCCATEEKVDAEAGVSEEDGGCEGYYPVYNLFRGFSPRHAMMKRGEGMKMELMTWRKMGEVRGSEREGQTQFALNAKLLAPALHSAL